MTIECSTWWTYDYNPFRAPDGTEIPSFDIFDGHGRRVASTDVDVPCELQETVACLITAAPALLAALEAQSEAVQAVIDAWQRGDLAGAVRRLDATLADRSAAIAKAKGGAQ